MKTYRILSILWMALCCYTVVSLLRRIPLDMVMLSESFPKPLYFVRLFLVCLFYLTAAVASFFLFVSGEKWARIFVGVIATLGAIKFIIFITNRHYISEWTVTVGIFDLVSAVLLFWP